MTVQLKTNATGIRELNEQEMQLVSGGYYAGVPASYFWTPIANSPRPSSPLVSSQRSASNGFLLIY